MLTFLVNLRILYMNTKLVDQVSTFIKSSFGYQVGFSEKQERKN